MQKIKQPKKPAPKKEAREPENKAPPKPVEKPSPVDPRDTRKASIQ